MNGESLKKKSKSSKTKLIKNKILSKKMLNKLHSNFLGLQNSKRKVKSLSNILILRTKLLNKCSLSLGNSTIWMVKGH